MKYSFHHFLRFVILSKISFATAKNMKLNAVSNFGKGMKELHERVRKTHSDHTTEKTRKRDMNSVCTEIIDSGYFRFRWQKKDRLRPTNPTIKGICCCGVNDGEEFKEMAVNGVVEKLFVCRATSMLKHWCENFEYLVSKEYNVSDIPGQYIAGRFVFNFVAGDIKYEALAEEPARIVAEGRKAEELYFRMKRDHRLATTGPNDPLCGLDKLMKVRICTLAMGSSYFVDKRARFAATTDHVWDKCSPRNVSFVTKKIIKESNEKIVSEKGAEELIKSTHQEWVIKCQVQRSYQFHLFCLSHAYGSHSIFVYTVDSGTGNIIPEILISDVRGMIDDASAGIDTTVHPALKSDQP